MLKNMSFSRILSGLPLEITVFMLLILYKEICDAYN